MATIEEARLAACMKRKYATYQILSLVPVKRNGLKTCAVDQHWRVYYDPEWLAEQSLQYAAFVMRHETLHLTLNHHRRGKAIAASHGIHEDDANAWKLLNVAGDLAINSILLQEDKWAPDDCLLPAKFNLPENESMEFYFNALLAQQNAQQEAGSGQQDDDQQEGNQDSQDDQDALDGESEAQEGDNQKGDSDDDNGDDDSDDANGQEESETGDSGSDASDDGESGDDGPDAGGDQSDAEQPGSGEPSGSGDSQEDAGQDEPSGEIVEGQGGSCADGKQRWWEDDLPDDVEPSEGEPSEDEADNPTPHGIPEWKQDQIMQQVAESAAKMDKGSVPGGMQEILDEILDPKIDPRKLLMKVVRTHTDQMSKAGEGRYSYRRPSRRQSNTFIRPSQWKPIPRITLVIDTSGSMGKTDLQLGVGLVANVLNGLSLRDGLWVMCFDAEPQWTEKIFDPSKIELRGRGGTDMSQAIVEAVNPPKRQDKPELVLVVTDGETDWPSKPVGVPVVVCLTRQPYCYFDIPKWMEVVKLYEKARR